MLVTCPACQRSLNAPENAAGKSIRCPLCHNVFAVAAAAAAATEVIAEEPRRPPMPPPPVESEFDFAASPSRQQEQFTFESAAPSGIGVHWLRAAGGRLLRAGVAIPGLIVLEAVIGMFNLPSHIPMQAAGYVLMRVFLIIMAQLAIATPFLVFMFIGGSFLRRARLRGLVITGAVMSIVLGVICLGRAGLITLALLSIRTGSSGEMPLLLPPLFISLFAAYVTLYAGIRTIVFMCRDDVRDAFDCEARI